MFGSRRQPGRGIRNPRVIFERRQQTTVLSFRSENLLTSVLCVWNAVRVWRGRCVGEVYSFFSFCRNQQVQTASYNQAGTVLNLRTPLNWDEECEVRANAIARADWVILHSVITLITILPLFHSILIGHSSLEHVCTLEALSVIPYHPQLCLSAPPTSYSPSLFSHCTSLALLPPICLLLCHICPSLSPVIELELYFESK